MPEFMLMIQTDEAAEDRLTPAETRALVEGQSAYERKLRASGACLDADRLRPSAEGRRVRVRDGQAQVEAGPFEASLASYYVLKAESVDAAVALAQECPLPPGASIDVRPLMKSSLQPRMSDQPGRVFAFAVLGNAANEPAWIDIMDRIDESSRDCFPERERFLGGVRLEPPTRGRRVTTTGGRRAVFDGPFLESKEVIGGVCFMRMSSVEEAVAWASQTIFVQLGTLEIRELWRS